MNNEQNPMALVYGEPMREPPPSLYIPPEAMRVMLDNFAGPLDLLLYLVRKHRFDILDIPMVVLCRQYAAYVEELLQNENNLEIAADYLAMATLLLDIKSKMLLPKPVVEDEDEDPRSDLVQRLLEYERLRDVSQKIGEMPRRDRDFVSPQVAVEQPRKEIKKPVLHPVQLSAAFAAALARVKQLSPYKVWRQNVNLREIMSGVLRALAAAPRLPFRQIVKPGLPGASFVAALQLAEESAVWLRQQSAEDELFVELRGRNNEQSDN
ncbi:MAG: segregation and condensation protein A [Gammaproteobacteria bacterium WSBS_2016_MAG_OTU1]